jgi:hypothetical protein
MTGSKTKGSHAHGRAAERISKVVHTECAFTTRCRSVPRRRVAGTVTDFWSRPGASAAAGMLGTNNTIGCRGAADGRCTVRAERLLHGLQKQRGPPQAEAPGDHIVRQAQVHKKKPRTPTCGQLRRLLKSLPYQRVVSGAIQLLCPAGRISRQRRRTSRSFF